VERTLGTAAKKTVILARQPHASETDVILTVGVGLAYFVAGRLSLTLLEPVDGVAVLIKPFLAEELLEALRGRTPRAITENASAD